MKHVEWVAVGGGGGGGAQWGGGGGAGALITGSTPLIRAPICQSYYYWCWWCWWYFT